MDKETNKPENPDFTARLDESDLLKPGTTVAPNAIAKASDGGDDVSPQPPPGEIEKDVVEYNKFAQAQQEQAESFEAKPKHSALHIIWELAKTLLIAVGVIIFINTFVFQAYYVAGASMNPDFNDGDYLLINKVPLSLHSLTSLFGDKSELNISRGDVLVFRSPENKEISFIKRVLALPGERITLKGGVFTVYNNQHPNGFVLNETYLDPQYKTQLEVDQVVEAGNLFVVGDNRAPGASYDSRSWGQLPDNNISGRAFFRLLPISNIGLIGTPAYK